MRVIFSIFLFTLSLWAYDLKELITFGESNELSKAYQYSAKAADDSLSATYRAYLPNIKAGVSRISADKTTAMEPDSVTTTYVTASAVLFDGFKRENLIREKKALIESADYDYSHYKKSLALDITKLYYSLLSIRAQIKAYEAKKNALNEEVNRLKKFFQVGNITQDKVEQIKAAYYQAEYDLILARTNEIEIQESLESLIGKKIEQLVYSEFADVLEAKEERDDINSLEAQVRSLKYKEEQQTANYYPTLVLEAGKYSYDYGEEIAGALDEQTKITLNLKLLEFDFFSKTKAKEAVRANRLALENRVEYQKKTVKTMEKISKAKVSAAKKRIESAKLMAKASKIAFELISKKYRVGVADNVDYLNALTDKYNTEALLEASKNDYQAAVAEYYFSVGADIKEKLQ